MRRPQAMIGAAVFLLALCVPLFVRSDYLLQVIFRVFHPSIVSGRAGPPCPE